MSERAQLKHLLLDVEFFGKPKIRALAIDQGQLSVLFLVRIYTALSAATDAKARKSVAVSIGLEMRFDPSQIDEFLAYCFEERLLEQDGNYITARRVIDDQEELARKQKKWRAEYERKKSGKVAEAERKESGVGAEKPQIREDLKNNEDLKKNTVADKFTITLPPEFNNPDVIKGFQLWGRKSKQNGRPLDAIGVEALLMRFGGRPKALAKALCYSAQLSRCMNVIEDPNYTEGIKNPSKQPVPQGGRDLLKRVGLGGT